MPCALLSHARVQRNAHLPPPSPDPLDALRLWPRHHAQLVLPTPDLVVLVFGGSSVAASRRRTVANGRHALARLRSHSLHPSSGPSLRPRPSEKSTRHGEPGGATPVTMVTVMSMARRRLRNFASATPLSPLLRPPSFLSFLLASSVHDCSDELLPHGRQRPTHAKCQARACIFSP